MKQFFELNTDEQVEKILEVIQNNKKSRTLKVNPVNEQHDQDPFIDLFWKLKEVEENHNPIPVPQNVRFRFIKRVISKLIRTYTTKQVNFNISTMHYLNLVMSHFKRLYAEQLKDKNEIKDKLINLEKMRVSIDDAYLESKIEQKLQNSAYVIGESVTSEQERLKRIVESVTSEQERLKRIVESITSEQERLKRIVESITSEQERSMKIVDKLQSCIEENDRRYLQELNQMHHRIHQIYDTARHQDSVIRSLENSQSRLDEWSRMNQIKEENANKWMSLLSERIDRLENYQNRVRKELFAELVYTRGNPDKTLKVNAEIINKEKYHLMLKEDNIRVNLGCGTILMEDYLNTDSRPLEGVDIVADVRSLPFEKESVQELYLAHVIEHFPEIEMEKYILPYWYSLLKPNGKIKVICPNWEAMLQGYSKGTISYEDLKEVTFGSQEYAGNFHFNMFTPSTLVHLLKSVGFSQIKVIESERRNGQCLEMEVEGVK